MTAAILPFPRDLLREPDMASATDLFTIAESDEEQESALYSVSQALKTHEATKAERSPVWRLLLRGAL